MNFGINHAPGAGSIAQLLICSPVHYYCPAAAPGSEKKHKKGWKIILMKKLWDYIMLIYNNHIFGVNTSL